MSEEATNNRGTLRDASRRTASPAAPAASPIMQALERRYRSISHGGGYGPAYLRQVNPSLLELIAKTEVPDRYRDDVLNHAIDTEAKREVDAFIEDGSRSILLLMGSRGTGKTCAAVWGAIWNLGLYVLAVQIAEAYRRLEVRDLVDRWCLENLLVIDELGREATDVGDRSRATIWEVVERRWAARRKTILATNLSERILRDRYDEPIWDRIVEDGGPIVLTGQSLRERPR